MTPSVVTDKRDEALRRFVAATWVNPHTDAAVQFIASAALCGRDLHRERVHVAHVANNGVRSAPERGLLPLRSPGWEFGKVIADAVTDGLRTGPVKLSAANVTTGVLQPLVKGHVLNSSRRGSPGDVELRRKPILTLPLSSTPAGDQAPAARQLRAAHRQPRTVAVRRPNRRENARSCTLPCGCGVAARA